MARLCIIMMATGIVDIVHVFVLGLCPMAFGDTDEFQINACAEGLFFWLFQIIWILVWVFVFFFFRWGWSV